MAIEGHLHRMQDHKTVRAGHTQPSGVMTPSYHPVVQLQNTIGNRAISRLIASGRVHPQSGRVMREETGGEEEQAPEQVPLQPLTEVTGQAAGDGDEVDYGRSISLQGLTTASFSTSTNSFSSQGTTITHATGCDGSCSETDPCVSVSTTIASSYSVPISVSLPNLATMDLTECERQQAQNWIDTVLSPHEQEHVAAFRTYNGTTSHPLNFTSCRSAAQTELNTRAQEMFNTERAARQSSAQTLSDALDPFNMDFEVNCPEPEAEEGEGEGESEGAPEGGE
jgi:hypothetical protein